MALSCVVSEEIKEQQRRNSEIDKQLELEKKEARKKIKLLMLGTEGCGKSSLVSNMRGLYGRGYTDEDKQGLIKYVHQQVFTAVSNAIKEMEKSELTFANPENENNRNMITNVSFKELTPAKFQQCVPAIESLWLDSAVQESFKKSYLEQESERYFLSNVKRIGNKNYVPTLQDIVRLQIVDTTKDGPIGVTEYPLVMDEMPVRLIHLKDRRSEWRKWIHCFDDANCILFLASLSHYDQINSDGGNRLLDDKHLFEAILGQQYFLFTPVILLFTKPDLLEAKLQRSNLAEYFPEYDGPEKDPIMAREFILRMFVESVGSERTIYTHFACSTDADAIKVVFAALKEMIYLKKYKLN